MRNFSARETEWLLELDGIELASFWRRALAFVIDWAILSLILSVIVSATVFGYLKLREHQGHPSPQHIGFDLRPEKFKLGTADPAVKKHGESEFVHILVDIAVPVLYFGLFTWKGKGRSPGKRLVGIRVVSLVHRHLTLWHAVERALGYAAAALEGGFGFVQFFIHPYRRCVQDRIAETIVVTERGYQLMQHKLTHPLLPDTGHQPAARLADETLPG